MIPEPFVDLSSRQSDFLSELDDFMLRPLIRFLLEVACEHVDLSSGLETLFHSLIKIIIEPGLTFTHKASFLI